MLNQQTLTSLVKLKNFTIGDYSIISQDPTAISPANSSITASIYLPMFIAVWRAIEDATGYRWKNTSYIRLSPSHKLGQAFDLAPDISPDAEDEYAVTHGSDPVLYKRAPLIRALQTLISVKFGPVPIGIFIEPDHLHIQALTAGSGERFPTSIVKWAVPKPIYSDTFERMKLPLIG